MPMKNPPHPGGFVLRQCIEPFGLTITDAAAALGVTCTTLSELVTGNAEFLLKWPCDCPRFSGAARKAGSPSRRTTTLPKSAPAASNSGGLYWLSRFRAPSFARRPLTPSECEGPLLLPLRRRRQIRWRSRSRCIHLYRPSVKECVWSSLQDG